MRTKKVYKNVAVPVQIVLVKKYFHQFPRVAWKRFCLTFLSVVQIKLQIVVHHNAYGDLFAITPIQDHWYWDRARVETYLHWEQLKNSDQLITSRIVDIQFDPEENDVILGPAKSSPSSTEMAMKIDSFWDDMKLLD